MSDPPPESPVAEAQGAVAGSDAFVDNAKLKASAPPDGEPLRSSAEPRRRSSAGSDSVCSKHLEETVPRLQTAGYAHVDVVETTAATKRKLLHEMSLDFPEASVTAIMGPSGSGKTTMLNFITGNITGKVHASGEVNLPGTNAYVPQDDRLHGFYTCHAYMCHYARLSGQRVDSDIEYKIEELLTSLGLADHRDVIVGDIFLRGLSGGQKRRLSVALEALTNPKNFFLDEPTSGLDAESAFRVMKFLKEYVRASPGRRVILTIHQPSSFLWQLIDNVILLAKGKLMYQGPRKKMEAYFELVGSPTPPEYNPADHYVTVVNDEFTLHERSVSEWAEKFLEYQSNQDAHQDAHRDARRRQRSRSTASHESAATRNSSMLRRSSFNAIAIVSEKEDIETERAGGLKPVLELTRRYFVNLWFNPGILGVRVAMYVMLALLIGALFWDLGSSTSYASIQSRIALLFYCVAFFVFMSVAVLPFTVLERAIVEKEVRNGYYHPALYQLAQAIASIPGTAFLAFLTTLIVILMTGLREPYWYFLDMFLALTCAEALAHLVSHVVPHFIIGMALIAGLYGLFMLLQGFMLVPSEFPNWLRWSYNIAFHTYSWRTFMYSEFGDDSVKFDSEQFPTGWSVLEAYEIEDVNRGNDMIVLVCYAIIIHLFSFLTLHIKYIFVKKGYVLSKSKGANMTPPDE